MSMRMVIGIAIRGFMASTSTWSIWVGMGELCLDVYKFFVRSRVMQEHGLT